MATVTITAETVDCGELDVILEALRSANDETLIWGPFDVSTCWIWTCVSGSAASRCYQKTSAALRHRCSSVPDPQTGPTIIRSRAAVKGPPPVETSTVVASTLTGAPEATGVYPPCKRRLVAPNEIGRASCRERV